MKRGTIILLAVVALLAIWTWRSYNGFIGAEEDVRNQWAKVESAYQLRADKSMNLEAIVTNAADFEKSTLTAVVEARSKASSISLKTEDLSPQNIQAYQQAQEQFGGALSRLLVTMERYPELKAMNLYGDFMAEYSGMENRIKVERDRYNDMARAFNVRIKRFPGNVLAGLFGFSEKGYFESKPGTEDAPRLFQNR
jgi:LemA protein